MTEKIDELQNNPMFRLSMSSLELFHSNFLEWLFDYNPSSFPKCFGIDVETDKKYKIQREYHLGKTDKNQKKEWITDIAVFVEENNADKLILIIENKIKSLPSDGQLESQSFLSKEKNETCKKVLLTLFDLPEDYERCDFRHVKYIDLVKEIINQYGTDNLYIKDYCTMIEKLHKIVDNVINEIPKGNLMFHKHFESLEKCGMQDAFRKYQGAQLAQIASNKFKDKYEMPIETGVWLQHKRACVNVFFKLKKIEAGVQIEHDQFRVFFEGKAIEKLYQGECLKDDKYKFLNEIWNDWLKGLSDGRKDNCKYGKNFVYRYVKIPENITIDALLEGGNWLENHSELSVKNILDKIIDNKDNIIKELSLGKI